jgi:hypothetical protein
MIFTFGLHNGKSVNFVVFFKPAYILWMKEHNMTDKPEYLHAQEIIKVFNAKPFVAEPTNGIFSYEDTHGKFGQGLLLKNLLVAKGCETYQGNLVVDKVKKFIGHVPFDDHVITRLPLLPKVFKMKTELVEVVSLGLKKGHNNVLLSKYLSKLTTDQLRVLLSVMYVGKEVTVEDLTTESLLAKQYSRFQIESVAEGIRHLLSNKFISGDLAKGYILLQG